MGLFLGLWACIWATLSLFWGGSRPGFGPFGACLGVFGLDLSNFGPILGVRVLDLGNFGPVLGSLDLNLGHFLPISRVLGLD